MRAVGEDGDVRERFVEGEPAVVEVELHSETPLRDGRLTITFRNETGESIGGRSLDGLELRTDRTTVARLCLPSLPLREGRFRVEARLHDSDGSEVSVDAPALGLNVFAHETGGEGPVRLGGSWEIETRHLGPLAELPER